VQEIVGSCYSIFIEYTEHPCPFFILLLRINGYNALRPCRLNNAGRPVDGLRKALPILVEITRSVADHTSFIHKKTPCLKFGCLSNQTKVGRWALPSADKCVYVCCKLDVPYNWTVHLLLGH
jgi:hypothetical protein